MITISVTQDDIAIGKRQNCEKCPIALAAIRAFPNKDIAVATDELYVMDEAKPLGTARTYPLPVEVRAFIHEFDMGRRVKPFTFNI